MIGQEDGPANSVKGARAKLMQVQKIDMRDGNLNASETTTFHSTRTKLQNLSRESQATPKVTLRQLISTTTKTTVSKKSKIP